MSENNMSQDKTIDKLSGMYQENPDQFESERKRLIQETIDSFPPEHRAKAHGLQFKIEATLNKYKDPVARMNKMVEIFWGHFQDFQDVLNNPSEYVKKNEESGKPAKVLPFTR